MGFFVIIHGIKFHACKKLLPSLSPHPVHRLIGGPGTGYDCLRTDVKQMRVKRIETGTPEGDALGFSSDLFSGWIEVYEESRIYLHYIISRHREAGNTQALIRGWLDRGYDVRVVMPRPIMQHIVKKFGFVPWLEYFPEQYGDPVEVWYLPMNTEVSGKSPAESFAAGVS